VTVHLLGEDFQLCGFLLYKVEIMIQCQPQSTVTGNKEVMETKAFCKPPNMHATRLTLTAFY
jgi:hypothetical protein